MIRSLLLSLATIAAVLLSSCSSSDGLFEYVPADVDFAVTANCDRVLADLGIEVSDNAVNGPGSLKAILKDAPAGFADNLAGFSKAVDMKEIVVFGYAKDNVYALARITDRNTLTDLLTKSGAAKESAGDYEIYRARGGAMIIDGERLWMTLSGSTDSTSESIDRIKAAANESNITADEAMVKALTADNAVNFTCRINSDITACLTGGNDIQTTLVLSALVPSLNNYRLEGGINVAESTIALDARIVNPESGENLSIPLLKKIDQSILSYIPAGYTVAVAAGLDSEQFTGLTATIKDFAGADPSIAKALEMMGNIDGTVGVACSPTTANNFGFGDDTGGKAIAFAQTKPGKAKEMSDFIVSMLKFTPGVQTSSNGTVTMLTRQQSAPLYITAENNLLFISAEPVSKASNKLTAPMKDAQFAYAVNLPSISDMTRGKCKFGLKGYTTYADGRLNACLETTGADLLSAYVAIVSALRPDTASESYWDEPDADQTPAIMEL